MSKNIDRFRNRTSNLNIRKKIPFFSISPAKTISLSQVEPSVPLPQFNDLSKNFFKINEFKKSASFSWSTGTENKINHLDSTYSSNQIDHLKSTSKIFLEKNFSNTVSLAFKNLESASELLKKEKISVPSMSHVWKNIAEKNCDHVFVKLLHEKYTKNLLKPEEAYFLYAQYLAYGEKINSSFEDQSKVLNKPLKLNENSEKMTWGDQISGLGDMISFTGILGNVYKGFQNGAKNIPAWISKPEVSLAAFEQNYREILDDMHFTVRWPLEKIWSPAKVNHFSENKNFFQKILFNNRVASSEILANQWNNVEFVQKIQAYGKTATSIFSITGAAWGLVCSALAGKIGAIGEQHGEHLFEWGDKLYSQWINSSNNQNAEQLGKLHTEKMVEIYPKEFTFNS